MKPTNLNPLFIDQIPSFSHLVTVTPQSKEQFLNRVKQNYCTSNVKTALFCESVKRSDFETIQLNRAKNQILFNHQDNE